MSEPENLPQEFRHIRAAMKAAESVTPGNELQEAAAADIIRLAFEMEVREAFPEQVDPGTTQPQA